MKIAFYADHPYYGQLANNGGTRTILLSVKALRELGHDACVVAHKDRFTWFNHDKPVREIPKDADVIVAVSISDLDQLIHADHGDARLAYWARPVESWQMKWEQCEKTLRKLMKRHGRIMANSGWQAKDLNDRGIPCELVFAGMDPWWIAKERYTIGGMGYHLGWQDSSKTRKTGAIEEILAAALRANPHLELMAFGSPERCTVAEVRQYFSNPDRDHLVWWYNHCDIFLCPNVHEGFYNCGAEATLCGCALLVDANQPQNGMSDYATADSAMFYRDAKQAAQWLVYPDYSKVDAAKAKVRAIGDRATNMARMVEVLSAD